VSESPYEGDVFLALVDDMKTSPTAATAAALVANPAVSALVVMLDALSLAAAGAARDACDDETAAALLLLRVITAGGDRWSAAILDAVPEPPARGGEDA
jgi:hypothetical protein